MGFELDDETVLRVSGVAAAAYAAHALVAPSNFHSTYNEKDQLYSEAMTRWFGLGVGCSAANTLVISASDANQQKALKNTLKAAGAGWLAAAGMTLYNTQEGVQKRELGYVGAAGQAALGALCLWRGFKEESEVVDVVPAPLQPKKTALRT